MDIRPLIIIGEGQEPESSAAHPYASDVNFSRPFKASGSLINLGLLALYSCQKSCCNIAEAFHRFLSFASLAVGLYGDQRSEGHRQNAENISPKSRPTGE